MTNEEFVKSVRVGVYDCAIAGTLATLRQPAGRRPHARHVEMSRWYMALDSKDQDRVADVVREATRNAVFSMLCMLDNVTSIRRALDDEVGCIRVWYETESGSTLVNDENSEMLHDVFASEVPPS